MEMGGARSNLTELINRAEGLNNLVSYLRRLYTIHERVSALSGIRLMKYRDLRELGIKYNVVNSVYCEFRIKPYFARLNGSPYVSLKNTSLSEVIRSFVQMHGNEVGWVDLGGNKQLISALHKERIRRAGEHLSENGRFTLRALCDLLGFNPAASPTMRERLKALAPEFGWGKKRKGGKVYFVSESRAYLEAV